MLIDSLSVKDYDEMITEDLHPLQFDSGNPFMSTQTVVSSENEFRVLPRDNARILDDEFSEVSMFFDNQIEYSLANLKKFENNSYVLNNIGLAYLNKGVYEEAKKYFNKALEQDSSFYPALANLARLYFKQDDLDKSMAIYNKLKIEYPEDVSLLLNMAHVYLKMENLNDAYDVLLEIIKKDDKNAAAYNNVGVVLILQNHYKRALSYLRHAIDVNIDFANAYNNIGVCYSNLKQHKRAISNYLVAISLNKDFDVAYKNLARSYQGIKEYVRAKDILNNHFKEESNDFDVYDMLACSSVELKEHEDALKYLAAALNHPYISQDNSEQSRILNNMSVVNGWMGRFAESDRLSLEAISICSDNSVAYKNLIFSLLNRNELSDAKIYIEKAKSLFPDNNNFLIAESTFLFRNKEYSSAIKIIKKVLGETPEMISAYLLLNHILTEAYSDYEAAIEPIKKGLKYEPKHQGLLNNLAYTLLMNDQVNDARQVLNKITAEDDFCLTATRGMLLIKEGSVKEGERLYNRAANIIRDDQELSNQVKQKKFLELAKHYLITGETKKVINNLKKGLHIRANKEIYRDQIKELLRAQGL